MGKSFNSTIPEKGNLLIIDGFNLAFRYKHSGERNFAGKYLQTVISFANSYGASRVVVLSDGGSRYRKNLFPGYKAGREELRANQSKEEAEAFQAFLDDWKVAFQLCSSQYTTIKYKGVEADDIAAYLVGHPKVYDKFKHIWLLSTDRDWDLLVDEKVSRFSYRTRKEITADNWGDHYPYSREDHISVKVLQGDKSDSIPGVAGIGEKRAANLIAEYGSALDIHAILPIEDKRVFMQSLNAFGDQLVVNYELMDLVTFAKDAVGPEYITDLEEKIENEILK